MADDQPVEDGSADGLESDAGDGEEGSVVADDQADGLASGAVDDEEGDK